MAILLSDAEIATALPKVRAGLAKYLWLQSRIGPSSDFHRDAEFRRRFNGFYRVRRGAAWQEVYYSLMGRCVEKRDSFRAVLGEFYRLTGRVEASFVSKLVASLDPDFPVIDAFVLKNVGLRLPGVWQSERLERVCRVYEELCLVMSTFLSSVRGSYLVGEFRRGYPTATISEMKMLDLVLWQARA
jgi:hypothetical protein